MGNTSSGGGGISGSAPPGFAGQPPIAPKTWSAEQVFNKLAEKGLAKNSIQLNNEQTQFECGGGCIGFIYEFSSEEEMKKKRKKVRELNEQGSPYTYSYSRDNILLVLPGEMLKRDEAREYKKALGELE
jgi:hypothetical protein